MNVTYTRALASNGVMHAVLDIDNVLSSMTLCRQLRTYVCIPDFPPLTCLACLVRIWRHGRHG